MTPAARRVFGLSVLAVGLVVVVPLLIALIQALFVPVAVLVGVACIARLIWWRTQL
jgi:hypothetical protein